jgi:hypothetical protein
MCVNILFGKPEGKRPLGDKGTDGGIILKLITGKCAGRVWIELFWRIKKGSDPWSFPNLLC